MEFNWKASFEAREQVRQPIEIQIETVYYYFLQRTCDTICIAIGSLLYVPLPVMLRLLY